MAVTTLSWYWAVHIGIHLSEWGFGAFGRACVGRTRELAVDTVFAKISVRLALSEMYIVNFTTVNTPHISPHVSPRNVVIQGPVKFT